MVFGAAIGYQISVATNNIFLATLMAFLSHYFLDFFPHVEYLESVESSMKKIKSHGWKKNISDITKVALDFFIGIIAIFIFSSNQPAIYLYAVVAIVPDGLTVVTLLFARPRIIVAQKIPVIFNDILLRHHKIHVKIQFLMQKKIPNFWRITTQVLAVAISILLLRQY